MKKRSAWVSIFPNVGNMRRDFVEKKVKRWRHLIVAVGMVPALVIYLGLVMQIADYVSDIHIILDFLFLCVGWVGMDSIGGKGRWLAGRT